MIQAVMIMVMVMQSFATIVQEELIACLICVVVCEKLLIVQTAVACIATTGTATAAAVVVLQTEIIAL